MHLQKITRNLLLMAAALLVAAVAGSCSSGDDEATKKNGGSATSAEVIDSSYTYELPVIFHVLYKDQGDASQYIPYQRLANILQYVNEIYQGVYGESEDVKVKFVLATTDESGSKLRYPGVEYVRYSGDYPIDPQEFMSDESGANVKYIWEPNDYINVMMYNFKQDNSSSVTLGISNMPYSVQGSHELEGLATVTTSNIKKRNLTFPYCSSINSLYANQGSDGGYYQSDRYTNSDHQPTYITSTDIVVTLAHELGHYLGLFHAFTELSGETGNDSVEPADSCADTDYCSDTKSYNRYEYTEYLNYVYATNPQPSVYDLLLRSACDGEQYYSANIMDYSLTLGYKISKEQKERIRHVLYYSPLIPGPKKGQNTRAAKEYDGAMHLKIRTIK